MNLTTYMKTKIPEWDPPAVTHPYSLVSLTGRALNALHARRLSLEDEVARLRTLDPVDAKPRYRTKADPRYLYLVHPQKNGQRVREYIGADPEKQAAALARVEAHKQITAKEKELAAIATRLELITRLLLRALRVAVQGHTW